MCARRLSSSGAPISSMTAWCSRTARPWTSSTMRTSAAFISAISSGSSPPSGGHHLGHLSMAITPKLELRQGQGLVMTPQLQQAIKLLQLSNLELAAFVDTELERNPLLEREDAEEP